MTLKVMIDVMPQGISAERYLAWQGVDSPLNAPLSSYAYQDFEIIAIQLTAEVFSSNSQYDDVFAAHTVAIENFIIDQSPRLVQQPPKRMPILNPDSNSLTSPCSN